MGHGHGMFGSMLPEFELTAVTDAHCHPTDLSPSDDEYAAVSLGGLAAMATNDDQEAVRALASKRGWPTSSADSSIRGPKVVACCGTFHLLAQSDAVRS